MKRLYIPKRFNAVHRQIIEHSASWTQEMARDGYDVTLRQVYYHLVAEDLFPTERRYVQVGGNKWKQTPEGSINAEPNYKWLGEIINSARLAGEMDWSHVVDRTRELDGSDNEYRDSEVDEFARRRLDSYYMDLRKGQPVWIEFWVEKEALVGVVGRAARQWGVPVFACRGYVSQTAMWEAGRRLLRRIADGQRVVILHVGDHDPSGIDMTRDIRDRLELFIGTDWVEDFDDYADLSNWRDSASEAIIGSERPGNEDVVSNGVLEVRRVALNMDQIRQYNPPPNPTKLTDARAAGYIETFGQECWELDALTPSTLAGLLDDEMENLVDFPMMLERQTLQEERRDELTAVVDRWDEIRTYLRENPTAD